MSAIPSCPRCRGRPRSPRNFLMLLNGPRREMCRGLFFEESTKTRALRDDVSQSTRLMGSRTQRNSGLNLDSTRTGRISVLFGNFYKLQLNDPSRRVVVDA